MFSWEEKEEELRDRQADRRDFLSTKQRFSVITRRARNKDGATEEADEAAESGERGGGGLRNDRMARSSASV